MPLFPIYVAKMLHTGPFNRYGRWIKSACRARTRHWEEQRDAAIQDATHKMDRRAALAITPPVGSF